MMTICMHSCTHTAKKLLLLPLKKLTGSLLEHKTDSRCNVEQRRTFSCCSCVSDRRTSAAAVALLQSNVSSPPATGPAVYFRVVSRGGRP